MLPQKLPVDDILPELREKLSRAEAVIVRASPGSGKTTRIPPALIRDKGEVLVLEPRRVAAKYAARRVAQELGCELGGKVGYQFRFENVTSAATRLRFLTEGMLMRRFVSDPELSGVHTVILDEFHERHLHGDIALAYLRRLQLSTRADLKLIIMSATLDTESLARFLGGAPVITIDAPLFPVELEYLPSTPARPLENLVRDAVSQTLSNTKGDILVFLPGMGEIRRSGEAIRAVAEKHDCLIAPLHGELSREEQDLAIEKNRRRKIILATNVAETSLTIEGVRTVIDSGFHRVASYSWWSGVPTLRTRPISRASAIQRAGRAGRTGPGKCIRLYTRGDFDGRAPFQTPEIQRADLTQSVLELKSLGITEPSHLNWFEAPSTQSLSSAETLLYRLGALESPGGAISKTGRTLVRIPAHPRIARMLLEAKGNPEGAVLGALISEGDLETLDAIEALRNSPLSFSTKKLVDLFEKSLRDEPSGPNKSLEFAILTGFPDRVARRSPNGDLVFSDGGSAKSPEHTLFRSSEYFVLLDVQERQGLGQARSSVGVRSAVAIQEGWLFDLNPAQVEEVSSVTWDADRKRVQSVDQIRYGQLVLSESRSDPKDPAAGSLVLAKQGLGLDLDQWGNKLTLHDVLRSLSRITHPDSPEGLENWTARLQLLRKTKPSLPEIDCGFFRRCIEGILGNLTSLQEVREIQWEHALTGCLEADFPGITGELEVQVPTHFGLPNGRKPPIHYQIGHAPWIESRLQDFFGVRSAPSILRGVLPLTLHLLAPNQRALQVTTDLPGFWKNTYPEIRKELSRRYPRHAWPEDPSKAEASDSKVKPRR